MRVVKTFSANCDIGLNWLKTCFLPPSRLGLYLMPPWTILAEILGDNSSSVGLPWGQISLDCVEAHGSSDQKHAKNLEKDKDSRIITKDCPSRSKVVNTVAPDIGYSAAITAALKLSATRQAH